MSRDYVPALGHRALTSLYDPINVLTMRESAWRKPVTERIADALGGSGTVVATSARGPDRSQATYRDPGGSLIVADWGPPSLISRPGFLAIRMLDGFQNTAEHARGEIGEMIRGNGFGDVAGFGRHDTIWGTLELLHARPRP